MESTDEYVKGYVILVVFLVVILFIVIQPTISFVIPFKTPSFLPKYLPIFFTTEKQISEGEKKSYEMELPMFQSGISEFSDKYYKIVTKFCYQVDYSIIPLIGVLLLTAVNAIGIDEWKNGIIGVPGQSLQPFGILTLFLSLAYICISLDATGVFHKIANSLVSITYTNRYQLLLCIIGMSSVLTVCTSNDVVILTLTPIICSLANQIKLKDATPLLLSQFYAANVWSSLLLIGNPTNVIVASGFNISFLKYSLIASLPAIVGSLLSVTLSYLIFIPKIPIFKEDIELGKDTESISLQSDNQPTLYGALITESNNSNDNSSNKNIIIDHDDDEDDFFDYTLYDPKLALLVGTCFIACLVILFYISWDPLVPMWFVCFVFGAGVFIGDLVVELIERVGLNGMLPSSLKVDNPYRATVGLSRLPWKVIPFMFSMFILTDGLYSSFWMGKFAHYLAAIMIKGGILFTVFFTMTVTTFAANVMNNIPMTIFFTKVFLHPNFLNSVPPYILDSAIYSLILSSNFAANLSLLGALAGIMWNSILTHKNRPLPNWYIFSYYGSVHVLFASVGAGLILATEIFLYSIYVIMD